jgi:HlyD family secretion protein
MDVRVDAATRGDLIEVITAPGEIQPRTKVSISARVAATIVALPYDEGAKVTKGTEPDGSDASVLVQLDAKDLQALKRSAEARRDSNIAQIQVAQARIESSKAQIDSQKASLADAQRDYDRQLGLLKSKDVSQSVVDTAETKVLTLKAQVEAAQQSLASDEANLKVMDYTIKAAQADVDNAAQNLSYTIIRSPIDGIVTKRKAEVGEMVMIGTMNNAGTVIMEVADLDQMMMFARVDETSIASVKVGQHAQVRVQAFPDDIFDGTVETVALARNDDQSSMSRAGASEGSTRYFEAKIKLDTKGRRIPSGLAADADIETKKHSGLKVPSQSVLGRPIESLSPELRTRPEVDSTKSIVTVVYRLVDGKAVATPVKVGPSDETHTLILSGLKEGDPVISGPFKVLETLAEGQAVKGSVGPTTKPSTQPTTSPATQP